MFGHEAAKARAMLELSWPIENGKLSRGRSFSLPFPSLNFHNFPQEWSKIGMIWNCCGIIPSMMKWSAILLKWKSWWLNRLQILRRTAKRLRKSRPFFESFSSGTPILKHVPRLADGWSDVRKVWIRGSVCVDPSYAYSICPRTSYWGDYHPAWFHKVSFHYT